MGEGKAKRFLTAALFLVVYLPLVILFHRFILVKSITAGMLGFLVIFSLPLLALIVKTYNTENTLREKQQILQKLHDANLELASLKEIGSILNSTLDLEVILKRSLKVIEKDLSFDGCAIWSHEPQECGLKLLASSGAEGLQLPSRISGSFGIYQRVFKQKIPLFFEDLEAQLAGEELKYIQKKGIASVMLQPVFDEHLPLGLIVLFSLEKIQFNEDKKVFLTAFVNAIALAIRNAWLYKKAYDQSIRDELTDLYNHRFLMGRLEEEVQRAIRLKHPLSILIFDLDDFKIFNDTYGHLEGNRVLAHFGMLLKAGVRNIDIPARFGGEEFVIILPETDLETAIGVAERLQNSIRNHTYFKGETEETLISCSIGGASLSEKIQNANQLLNEADIKLYKAKQQKDCVVA